MNNERRRCYFLPALLLTLLGLVVMLCACFRTLSDHEDRLRELERAAIRTS